MIGTIRCKDCGLQEAVMELMHSWAGLFKVEPKLRESARTKEACVRLKSWKILEEEIDTQDLHP